MSIQKTIKSKTKRFTGAILAAGFLAASVVMFGPVNYVSAADLPTDRIYISEVFPSLNCTETISWVEIYNPTDSTIDISGFALRNANNSTKISEPVSAGTILAAKSYYVMNVREDGGTSSTYCLLPNRGAVVAVYNNIVSVKEGVLVDSISYTTSCNVGSIPKGASCAIQPDGTWQIVDEPTKGFANFEKINPIEPVENNDENENNIEDNPGGNTSGEGNNNNSSTTDNKNSPANHLVNPSATISITNNMALAITQPIARTVAIAPVSPADNTETATNDDSATSTDIGNTIKTNNSSSNKDSNIDPEEVLGATDAKSWSLVNLILAVLIALGSIITLLAWLGRKDDSNNHCLLRTLTLVPAIGAVVLFLLVEDWSLPMQMVNSWTWLMAAIAVVQIGLIIAATRRGQSESALNE